LARREAFIAGQLERHAAVAKDLQTSGLGDGTFDIDTARRLAKLQFRASERPQRMTDAMQERMVELALRTHGAGEEVRSGVRELIAEARAESRALRAAGAEAVFPQEIVDGMSLPAVTVWGTRPAMGAVGQFLRDWQDPIATVGRTGIKVGQFVEDNWLLKHALIGVEAITTPWLFAGRKVLEYTPLGPKIAELEEEGFRRGAEYIDGTARLKNPQLSTEMMAGIALGTALVAGGISLFSKLAPMAGGFLKKVTDTIPARGAGGIGGAGRGGAGTESWSPLAKSTRAYVRDIGVQTGMPLTRQQRALLAEDLRVNGYSRLSPEAAAAHRAEFGRMKSDLIREWEANTGQSWPTYSQDVASRNGTVIRRVGQPYDAHHVIESSYGGPNKWWNIHPARFPDQHQGGIHRSGSPGRTIFGN
jgi:hypothetical protein